MIPSNSALSPLLSKKTLQNHGCKENNHGSKENSYFKCTFNYNSKLIHHDNNLRKKITEGEGGMVEWEKRRWEEKRNDSLHIAFLNGLLVPEYIPRYCTSISYCWSFTCDNGISLQADFVVWIAFLV